tara:strand:- start:584 stop:1099 length:516 start_codon:yes stop_codon:yes gene_type:complete
MAYQGNPLYTAFSTINKQDLTGGTGTNFTLDYSVSSPQDIEVFVNNVRQEPGVAYTTTGTSLTMTGAIIATDDFYVVFQGKAQQTAVPGAGTITQAMFAPGLNLGAGYFQGDNGDTGDTTNGKKDIFRVHEQELNTNTTIAATDNALCAGPLTIATGVTLTVTTGGNLVIA